VVIVLEPLLESLAVVPRLAITTAVTVPIMTWLVMPRVTRLLRGGSTPGCPRLRRRRPRTRVGDGLDRVGRVRVVLRRSTLPSLCGGAIGVGGASWSGSGRRRE
jgi:hypothetical protein